jgi:hypothetical protein
MLYDSELKNQLSIKMFEGKIQKTETGLRNPKRLGDVGVCVSGFWLLVQPSD